jgi:rhodanese-related sulfurtransferase
MKIAVSAAGSLVCFCLVLFSMQATADPYGIELEELDGLLKNAPEEFIFIDVRDPVEIMFTGFTDAVDRNIPFQMVDRTRWDEKKGVFVMVQNPEFALQVEALLREKGLSKDSRIVTMCRSGSARGKPSAEFLRGNGFSGARYLINGFQGSSSKEGDHKGMRVSNGWQNSGMPWQKKPNPLKIFRD